jgi:hypothetical protein
LEGDETSLMLREDGNVMQNQAPKTLEYGDTVLFWIGDREGEA